ncbi:fic family toxin-antitoxin system, toxin component [Streptomyces sp. NPDC087843]|uniref:fic family toxin-antitoxin system, toxin component n=1 Tax=Streptomyces sp. NPDC087843 TaxID=3365804 RepID=UPI00382A8EC0
MYFTVDLPWLLEVARTQLGDPDITDWGALAAAQARHAFDVMEEPAYPQPWDRAASLFHSLARIPALEPSNELFGAAVAVGYLHASGVPARILAKEAADVAEQVSSGRTGVQALAAVRKEWTERS